MTPVLDFNGTKVLKMQQINSQSLLLFDENVQLKKYKLQVKTMKMKLVEEYRIQVLKKTATKDNYSEFEAQREKRVERHIK